MADLEFFDSAKFGADAATPLMRERPRSEREVFDRWLHVIRQKATRYEHSERERGHTVTSPSLDELANEIEAYLTGRGL